MYEGNPGNQGVYPSKYDEDEELGLIRIDLATISVVKKKFSSTKTKPQNRPSPSGMEKVRIGMTGSTFFGLIFFKFENYFN